MLWLETYYCLTNINSYYLTKPKIPFRVYENKHTTTTFLKHGAQYSNVNVTIGCLIFEYFFKMNLLHTHFALCLEQNHSLKNYNTAIN